MIRLLLISISLLLFSQGVSAQKEGCITPSDGIYKFDTLNRELATRSIVNALSELYPELTSNESKQVENWVRTEVFSTKRGSESILEWDLDDPDFCQTRSYTFQSPEGVNTDTVSFDICNSILKDDVSANSQWSLRLEDTYVSLTFCNEIIEKLDRVGYYEVKFIDGRFQVNEPMVYKDKYHSEVTIYLSTLKTERSIPVLKDTAFLYTVAPVMD